MLPITDIAPEDDFQSELPLEPMARQHLLELFDSAWFDPAKIHRNSAQLRNLINEARESIASHLGIASSELEIVGELGFGFQCALAGLLTESKSKFIYSTVDRQVIHAFARQHQARGGEVLEQSVDSRGIVDFQVDSSRETTLSFQAVNRETGVIQNAPKTSDKTAVFADMSSAYPLSNLPDNWDSAIWDPKYFGGPSGIALVGIANSGRWQNPGPIIDKRRVYGSFSKPLLLATAVALENWTKRAREDFVKLTELNSFIRQKLISQIKDIKIAGDSDNCDPRFLAFVIPGTHSEEVLRKVEAHGVLIDAGSACGSGPLSPSHVLTAMGYSENGNYRITLKPAHNKQGLEKLVSVLVKGIAAGA